MMCLFQLIFNVGIGFIIFFGILQLILVYNTYKRENDNR